MTCPYCYPSKRKSHFITKINFFTKRLIPFSLPQKWENYLFSLLIKILSPLRIFELDPSPKPENIFNRTLLLWEKAKEKNIKIWAIKFLGAYTNLFQAEINGKTLIFEGIPVRKQNSKVDQKDWLKEKLKQHNLPIPLGASFWRKEKAFQYGQKLGFPLVTKPVSGSLSHHVTCDIKTPQKLKEGVAIAKQYSPKILVEKHIPGFLFRATVINREKIFVCKKEPANVIGDGKKTVQELIKDKNRDPKRGKQNQKHFTLHRIPLSGINQKLLGTVPQKKEKVFVQQKAILSLGCDVIDYTEDIHPDNKKMFLKAAEVLETDLVGIDFICSDIRKSFRNQICGIIEANTLPYIDMHQIPSQGQSQPIAQVIWKAVEED